MRIRENSFSTLFAVANVKPDRSKKNHLRELLLAYQVEIETESWD